MLWEWNFNYSVVIVQALALLISGVYYQVSALSSCIARLSPAIYASEGIGVFVFAQAERYAKRRGKLKRSG